MPKISNKPHFSKVSTDSFKLRIPLNLVEVIDITLLGTWQYVNDKTGEVNPYFNKKNSVTIKSKGITTRYGIEQQVGKNKQVNAFLVILINAKILGKDYFQGFTIENIPQVYKELMAQKVVTFNLSDFLKNSYGTDVDFKKDVRCKQWDRVVNEMRTISKQSKQKNKGYSYFNQKNNKGIEWSTRKTTSYKSNPYLKVYHKEIELKNNSLEFKNEYLQGQNIDNLVRIETTIKNNAHFRYLGLPENRLENILSLTDEQKETIMQSALSKHLEPRINNLKNNNELKPMEKVLYGYINLSLDSGMSFERGKNLVLKTIDNKTERSRKRKQLDEIYNKHIKGSKNDLKSIEIDDFWSFINW